MTQLYKTGSTSWRKLALLGLLSLGATAAQAQFRYVPNTTQNVAGTYTDLGTAGTAITTPNFDDANSDAQDIGFTFNFNGQDFTQFVLNTNGYLRLGSTAPAAPYFYSGVQDPSGGPMNTASQTNLILPFNLDLMAGTAGAEYRVATTGTAPNRVCTIQWKNVSDKTREGIAVQYDNFSFQVKLYETSNQVDFVYNAPALIAASADGFKAAAVGLKGSGTATNQALVMQKTSAGAWSAAFPVAGNYPASTTSVFAHSVRKTVAPTAGRTYRFITAPSNDAQVQTIYSLGKLPIPYATPHVIQAVVTNAGAETRTNLDVTATITGANTFTNTKRIASLAVGASTVVSFDAFSPTVEGNNTITVSVPGDDNNANNTVTFAQQVNTTTYAYAQAGVASNASLGNGTAAAILATKYTTPSARSITAINAYLTGASSVGKTVYGVLTNAAGIVQARTASYVITEADLNKFKTFTFDAPVGIATGDFYAGVYLTASTTAYSPIGTQLAETPLRSNVYYAFTSPAAAAPSVIELSSGTYGALMIEAVTGNAPTCTPPTAVTVTGSTSNTAVVNITGPTNATGYTVVYGPQGFDPTAAGVSTATSATSPVTLTGLTPSTFYDVYVYTNCSATNRSALTRPVLFTTQCVAPTITAFPYIQNFDGVAAVGGALPCGISVADANNDGTTWTLASGTFASPLNSMRYSFSATRAADDWFFTPGLTLRGGSSYQLSFKLRGPVLQTEKIEVKYGTGTTAATQSTLLYRNEALTQSGAFSDVGAGQVAVIRPATDGTYYVGFHAYSNPDQFSIYVDDISISSVVTGSSDALLRAINIFPNPTEGKLAIDVKGLNTKGDLQVEVSNLLGQRVHTSAIRNNFENRIDLSGLANGMYTVKVRMGNDYMVRNVTVQK